MDATTQHKHKLARQPFKRWQIVLGFITGVVVIAAAAAWALDYTFAQKIERGGYQVVYLTNGQAYFGKLQNTKGEYLVMKEPYTAQSVAQGEAAESAAATTLLKVSQQVYGPQDSIAIKSDQVSFWQNLRSDSKVAAALTQK